MAAHLRIPLFWDTMLCQWVNESHYQLHWVISQIIILCSPLCVPQILHPDYILTILCTFCREHAESKVLFYWHFLNIG